jgi:MFS family permease
MTGRRRSLWAAVLLCMLSIAGIAFNLWIIFNNQAQGGDIYEQLDAVLWSLSPLAFVVPGALIFARQPRNTIGLLLVVPGLLMATPLDLYLRSLTSPPVSPSVFFYLLVWLNGWGWVLLIFPLLFIPLLFPTGRPLSSSWRWVLWLGVGMLVFFTFVAAFAQVWGPIEGYQWAVRNPIGFISQEWFDTYFMAPWSTALAALTFLSVISLLVRFKRAGTLEREQIKWLLYACAVFVLIYIPGIWISDMQNEVNVIWSLLFILAILCIPLSIAVAILRYRLYDIDVIIRRTLVYGWLTATLALVYFGGVVFLQGLLVIVTGESRSEIVTVVTTLAIAALFTPLRKRIQRDIDRRFYRRKYNAEQALASFALLVRDETNLDELTGRLVDVVQETIQPADAWLLLRDGAPNLEAAREF